MDAHKATAETPKQASSSKKNNRKTTSGGSASIVHGSVLISQLPSDLPDLYRGIVQRFFATDFPAQRHGTASPKGTASRNSEPEEGQQHEAETTRASTPQRRSLNGSSPGLFSRLDVIEEADNATLLLEVPNKEAAKKLFKRLQNVKCCGRRWKVQYLPLSQVTPRLDPCLMHCTLFPAAPQQVVEEVLRSIPGFLAVAQANRAIEGEEEPEESGFDGPKAFEEDEGHLVPEGTGDDNEQSRVTSVLASFCDEGSALHARAVLSGRLIGSSGVRMFVERFHASDHK